ncbi:hypothetical protein LLEC1_01069 [Akanthomyces lecanii]|uniref:Uncharacterized protein n=1 Tax=Cordyceps confragosa TaxID=2714763 RepID=A0A179IBR0_CORDF|nr:hypothetical protein LLEC1_01069 [Akanthomyces lecanii]
MNQYTGQRFTCGNTSWKEPDGISHMDGAGAVATAGQDRTNSKFAASMTAEESANTKYAITAYRKGMHQPILQWSASPVAAELDRKLALIQ